MCVVEALSPSCWWHQHTTVWNLKKAVNTGISKSARKMDAKQTNNAKNMQRKSVKEKVNGYHFILPSSVNQATTAT